MATPGKYDAPAPKIPQPPVALTPVWGPENPDGAFERMRALQDRMSKLRPKLTASGADSSRLLQAQAIAELGGQKSRIEKYLVEARLAVARLYDRQLGDSPSDAAADKAGDKP